MKSAIEWLLEPDQPSIRYLALTELLGKKENDPDVSEAMKVIPERGWAADILARQHPEGYWEAKDRFYGPKYFSTNWMLLILSDLGLTKKHKRIALACEQWMGRFSKADGGFGMDGAKSSHLCITGNTARALIKFGYDEDPRVTKSLDWLVENAAKLGGWSCFGSGRNLDSWEPLSAFAVYPRKKWTKNMHLVVEKAAEFYLERELHKQGEHYEPWYRFHYPTHYYYDLMVGLYFMTALGYTKDKRFEHAVQVLKKKKGTDGRWKLDAVHPDAEGGMGEWYAKHPKQAPKPFNLEKVGEPSKMITLRAMIVEKRLGEG